MTAKAAKARKQVSSWSLSGIGFEANGDTDALITALLIRCREWPPGTQLHMKVNIGLPKQKKSNARDVKRG